MGFTQQVHVVLLQDAAWVDELYARRRFEEFCSAAFGRNVINAWLPRLRHSYARQFRFIGEGLVPNRQEIRVAERRGRERAPEAEEVCPFEAAQVVQAISDSHNQQGFQSAASSSGLQGRPAFPEAAAAPAPGQPAVASAAEEASTAAAAPQQSGTMNAPELQDASAAEEHETWTLLGQRRPLQIINTFVEEASSLGTDDCVTVSTTDRYPRRQISNTSRNPRRRRGKRSFSL